MDIVMCNFDFNAHTVEFAGANNALYVFTNNELKEIKADKQAISGSTDEIKKPYTNHKLQLQKGDVVYLFTDGYADQFGGPKGKKFKYKQLQNLLAEIQNLPMTEQRNILETKMREWKGELEQIDDILVVGILL